jgi:hypothetical protein
MAVTTTATAIIKIGTNSLLEAPATGLFIFYSFLKFKRPMDRFKKEITVNNETRVFEFNRMQNMIGVKFFITSTDSKQKPIAFSLTETGEGNWRLTPGSLRWLYDIETELSNAILEKDMR